MLQLHPNVSLTTDLLYVPMNEKNLLVTSSAVLTRCVCLINDSSSAEGILIDLTATFTLKIMGTVNSRSFPALTSVTLPLTEV